MAEEEEEKGADVARTSLRIHKINTQTDYRLWWESVKDAFYLLGAPDLYLTRSERMTVTATEEATEKNFPSSTLVWRRRMFPAIKHSLPKDLILNPRVTDIKRGHVEGLIRIVRNK